MNQRDSSSTFDDDDKTVIRPLPPIYGDDHPTIMRPSPGGRRRQVPVNPPAQSSASEPSDGNFQTDDASGLRPLTASAFALLSVVSKLRNLPFHQAIHDLQERLVGEIKDFEERAQHKGASPRQVKIASYFLCALIDDTVLNTPWGNQSNWAQTSLSIQIHRRAVGGTEFFQILKGLMQQPAQNLDLVELAYLCLSLGFQGEYRNRNRGLRTLEELRQELFLVLQRMKGDPERDLSLNWQGLRDLRSPLTRYVPLWVYAAAAVLLLTFVYLGFSYAINSDSDRVYNQLHDLAQEKVALPPIKTVAVFPDPEKPQPPITPPPLDKADRFRTLLAAEIAQHMVKVEDGPILRISNAFPSGSDQIRKDFQPMLAKIAGEVRQGTTRIVVIGHTDNRPIKFSARFKSNWELSLARARNVASLLAADGVLEERIRSEGRGDREPIVPNDTKQNRALNRRIDIHIR
jgi:type VI secretion system protein ImpK